MRITTYQQNAQMLSEAHRVIHQQNMKRLAELSRQAQQQQFMQNVRDRFPEKFSGVRVLDVGSLDINGNNRFIFTDYEYIVMSGRTSSQEQGKSG